MAGKGKRRPDLPEASRGLLDAFSKADLLEAAWDLASLCHPLGCDEHEDTRARLIQAVNERRACRGARLILPSALPRRIRDESGAIAIDRVSSLRGEADHGNR